MPPIQRFRLARPWLTVCMRSEGETGLTAPAHKVTRTAVMFQAGSVDSLMAGEIFGRDSISTSSPTSRLFSRPALTYVRPPS